MRTASLSTGHFRNGDKKYYVNIYSTPWWKYLIYKAYHFYDMRIPNRVPGWRRLEHWLRDHGATMMIDER